MEKRSILKHALTNALQHDGKADVQAVLGKLISETPEIRGSIKVVIPEIKKVVKLVNSYSQKKQEQELKKMGVKLEKKKAKEKEGLPDLPNAEIGKVVMRLAPYPSGPLHIGNARMIILNDEYVKKYRGKLFLVIDDTIGSEEKFITPESYDLIIDGLKWLGVKYNELIYKSDRLEIFYEFAEKLISENLAYVCECDSETLRKNRMEGIECLHRNRSAEENLSEWKGMLSGKYKEGDVVLRLKTDMKHPNPAFRDRVLLRVVERQHPRVGNKYRVWPMLEFSWAIDDHLLGITHIVRGKDLVMEDMMEEFIWNKLGWKKPEFIHFGLLNIKEAKLSKTQARKAIETGTYSGWDDPRTWSLQSLKRRGIKPEAIRSFIIDMSLSLADVTVPAEILYAENRKIIDQLANRYFAVFDPVGISIEGKTKTREIEAPLHPDFKGRGNRKITVDLQKVYVEREDFEKFKNEKIGLMNLFSIKLNKNSKITSERVEMDIQKIHWVSEPHVEINMIMPDGSTKKGIAEPGLKNVKTDEIVQLQRVGFARIDEKNGQITLYFAHK